MPRANVPSNGEMEEIMCRIFVNQDPKSYAFKARSVRLAGYSTSVRLERQFWDILAEIAARQELTLPPAFPPL